MRRFRTLFWLFSLLTAPPVCALDFSWNPGIQQAYAEAFRLRLDAARQLTMPQRSHNGLALYVDDCADALEFLLDEETTQLEPLLARSEARLARLERADATSPWNRFVRAEIKLHQAFVKLRSGRETAAGWNAIQAYRLLAENARRYPAFLPQQKTLGLLHILIGSTPESYQWATRLLGLRGSTGQGLAELARVARQDPVFRLEAQLITAVMQAYVLPPRADRWAAVAALARAHPDHGLVQFMAHSIALKLNRSEEALALLDRRPRGDGYLDSPYCTYHRAEILLQKGDYAAAAAGYQAFLRQYRGANFRKDAHYKRYLAFALQQQDALGEPDRQQAEQTGQTQNEADKAAARAATAPPLTTAQKRLLQARLAFDGGYLQAAAGYLESIPEATFAQPRDRAEYQYRLGRIAHQRTDTARAGWHYRRSLALSAGPGWSFGASAALQLGYLSAARHERPQARAYFERALAFRRHEYKNSIDTKAKAALNALGY
jgi:hypothetical protein